MSEIDRTRRMVVKQPKMHSMKKIEFAAGCYWVISLFAMLGEPETKSLRFVAAYYAIAICNLLVATYILKRVNNATSTNRNRVQKCSH